MQGRLRHLAVRVGGVALLAQLDLEDRQLGDLLAHLLEAPRHALAQLLGDRKVASLDLDPHGKGTPLVAAVIRDRMLDPGSRIVNRAGSPPRSGARSARAPDASSEPAPDVRHSVRA